ncbi:MAG: cytochrome C oxidase subunit III, partial [Betaproteobacteria bacterium]|nr:cytochrome C oxidase subunit III [Betaproteobacteria bacterium]MDA8384236.1 cytochrome C oxidase subunit III [Betaproteobacteria bacterium]
AVAHTIEGGVYKGVMPTWKDRLTPVQIKVLTAYVHELGGGQ